MCACICMSVCMCVCICVYERMHVQICVFVPACACVYVRVYERVCVCACVSFFILCSYKASLVFCVACGLSYNVTECDEIEILSLVNGIDNTYGEIIYCMVYMIKSIVDINFAKGYLNWTFLHVCRVYFDVICYNCCWRRSLTR